MKQVSLIFFSLLFAHPCLAEEGWTARLEICDPDIRSEIQTLPTPVTMLDGRTLEHKCVKTAEGKFIKLFQLTAEEILTTFYSDFEPGPAYGWGYNGSTPGPVIEAFEGERVRIEVINRLPEPTSVHWHGLELPNRMDGAAPHTQDPILPGGTFTYEFELKQYGTYMYHAHMHQHKQLALGLMGFFIIHPKLAIMPQVDHDILLFLQMWAIPPHSRIPDAMAMGDEFNFFTINGRTAPGTSPIVVNPGEEIRVRIASLNEMPHPIHLHGHTFKIVAEGAERHNLLAQPSANTVVVTAGQTAEIEFTAAEYTGDKSKPDVWMLHCHLPHHVTNNMHVPPVPGEPMAHEMAGMMTTVIIQPKESAPQDPPTSPTPPSHPHRGHGDHDHAMGPIMGRYTGSIELSNGRKFLASLDLFKVQEDGEWRKLKGVLTLPLGDFRSHEYLIYEYEGNEEIRANPQTGALQFNGTPQGLTLQDMRYMEHEMGGRPMKMLMGKVRTPFGAVIGNLNLDLQDPLKMEAVPIFKKGGGITDNAASFNILPLAGEYTGLCQKGNVELLLLQIETARGMNELEEERVTSPFGAYHITGRLGRRCDTSDSTCIWQAYESGTYNFFTGQLFLTGAKLGNPDNSRDLLCQVDGNTILCDKCRFAKVEEGAQKSAPHLTPTASSREFHLELPESPKVTELSSLKEMRGSFFGYLHHEQLDQYQALRLDVRAYYSTDFGMMQIPRPQIEGVAHLFFGTPGNSQHGEPLTYAFRPRPFLDSSSRHTDQKNGLTFSDEERGIFLVIEEWKKESIRGVWYSHTRGRIGTIELLRGEELPLLPPEAVSIPSIEGGYLAGEGDQPATHHLLELKSHPFFNAEFQPHNPYFPLTLTGDLKFFSHDGLVYTDPVIFGSYDFYTGHVALLLDAGKGHRMLTGRISPKGKLLLSLPPAPANGAVIQNHRLSLVR